MMIELRETLLEAIRGDKKAERMLVAFCARIAEAYLRTKSLKNDHLIQFSSASYPDFALDAIADLFKRKDGVLVIFERWYERVQGDQLSMSDLFIHFRGLIFSSVNDHIFASYRQMDSSLSRIIRNIKRGISEHDIEGLTLDSDDQSMYLDNVKKPLLHLNPEILEIKLGYRLSEAKNTLEILQKVRIILEDQDHDESYKIGITALATVIRKLYSHLNEEEFIQDLGNTELFTEDEWDTFIDASVEHNKTHLHTSYVVKKKLTDELYNAYFFIVREILRADYQKNLSNHYSFYDHMRMVYPELTKDQYKKDHRVILEYFVKKTRNELTRRISKEVSSAKRG